MLLHRLKIGWVFSLLQEVKLGDRTKTDRIT